MNVFRAIFHKSYSLLLLAMVSLSWEAVAQFTADAEFRINPVYSRGFREPLYDGEKPGFYTMQRTRLIMRYEAVSDLKLEMVLQDRRFWGDQDVRADVPNIAVFRAWVEKYFTPQLSVKLGRQGLVYDDQYLFGELNWGGTLAHDAALLKYEGGFGKAHLGAAFNSNGGELKREHYNHSMYKSLQYLWLHKNLGELSSSLILVNHGVESPDTTIHYTQTFGTNTSLKLTRRLAMKAIYYHQLGHDVGDNSVNAFLFSFQTDYKHTDKLSLRLGVDVNSGTSGRDLLNPEYKQNNTFDRYFGLLHGQFGYLDYFFVRQPTLQGIEDYYVKMNLAYDKLSINEAVHGFASHQEIDHSNGRVMNDFLGVENDLKVTYKLSATCKATLGHSIMFGTDTFEEFFGGHAIRSSQFVYAVITASPRLFEIE